MATWKYSYRRINGKKRRVKFYRKRDGNEIVRIVKHRNYSDKTRISKKRKKKKKGKG